MSAQIKPHIGPGRPKDMEKRAAILEAAKRLFVQNGYDGVSMDAIAAEAGVSKLTVYSHYQDKEALFTRAVGAVCEEMLPDELFLPDHSEPISTALLKIGHRFFALVSSDVAMNLHRTILADTRNGAKLGQMFWQAGPQRIAESLERFLAAAVARGQLQIEPSAVTVAARHFLGLLKGEVNRHMLCAGSDAIADRCAGERHVEEVVAFFLRAYLPRPVAAG